MKPQEENKNYLACGEFSGNSEPATCPLCRPAPPASLIYQKTNDVKILQCTGCEVMYASPRFTEESLLAIYENPSFINKNDYAKFDNWSYEEWKKNADSSYITSSLKVDLIRSFITKTEKILDVGCAMGLFVLEAIKQGYSIQGLEPSRMLADIGRKNLGVPIHNVMLENFTPDYTFKGIMIWDVLEHVYDPVKLMKKCNSLTEKGGYIFLQVPNFEGISDRIKTFLCKMRLKHCDFKHFGFPWHIYSFNRASIAKLLHLTGYKPVAFESWSHQIKHGHTGKVAKLFSDYVKARCLSDYITCVGQKE